MKLTLLTQKIIKPCMALWPLDMHSSELLSKAKEGTQFYTECTSFIPPTIKQMNTARWLAKILFDNDPKERFYSAEEALEYLMVKFRYAETRINPVTEAVMVMRKSLKDLSREELSDVIERSLIVLQAELGTSRPEFIREVMIRVGHHETA